MSSAGIAVFICGFFVTWLSVRIFLPLAKKLKYIDQPSDRKLHKTPTPYGGGVAIFASLAFLSIAFFIFGQTELFKSLSVGQEVNFEFLLKNTHALAIAFGGVGLFVLGLVDDLIDIRASLKLLIQFVIIILVVIFGPRMSFFVPLPILGIVGTVLWIILISNAFNLLDNMDGLCSGVAMVTLGIHIILLFYHQQYLIGLMTVLFFSCILAFFIHNAPPAKIYLGDAGSLLIGYIIAILSVLSTYYREGEHLSAIFTPLIILSIPLYDVATVMVIRFKKKKPFFQADKNHFSHRLLNLGLSPAQALITICLLSLAMGLAAIRLSHSDSLDALIIFCQCFLVFIVVVVLEYAGQKARKNSPSKPEV